MAMDIYIWFMWRSFCLRRSGKSHAFIPWRGLMGQYGASYGNRKKETSDPVKRHMNQDVYSFKSNFKEGFRDVLIFRPDFLNHVEDTGGMLKMTPCELRLRHRKMEKVTK
jgi:hypothetical protein